jgi:endogenous inhibitor of DNA gyrase (YacG/DUF329 family)
MRHTQYICIQCKKVFTGWRGRERKFCSRKCYFIWLKGRPIAEVYGQVVANAKRKKQSDTMKRKIKLGVLKITPIDIKIRQSLCDERRGKTF